LTVSNPSTDQPGLLGLFEQDRRDPLVRFARDLDRNAGGTERAEFSPDGQHLIWGNVGGSVTLVDLVEVNRRLSELALGW
jgi:hypothetical protein